MDALTYAGNVAVTARAIASEATMQTVPGEYDELRDSAQTAVTRCSPSPRSTRRRAQPRRAQGRPWVATINGPALSLPTHAGHTQRITRIEQAHQAEAQGQAQESARPVGVRVLSP